MVHQPTSASASHPTSYFTSRSSHYLLFFKLPIFSLPLTPVCQSSAPQRRLHTSLTERLFLPLFWVEPYKQVVGLHLDPPHLIRHVHPAFRAEELRGTHLCLVVRHVVKHVEEHSVGKSFDLRLWKTLRFAHVVALWDPDVYLKAVIVVCVGHLGLLWLDRRGTTRGHTKASNAT